MKGNPVRTSAYTNLRGFHTLGMPIFRAFLSSAILLRFTLSLVIPVLSTAAVRFRVRATPLVHNCHAVTAFDSAGHQDFRIHTKVQSCLLGYALQYPCIIG